MIPESEKKKVTLPAHCGNCRWRCWDDMGIRCRNPFVGGELLIGVMFSHYDSDDLIDCDVLLTPQWGEIESDTADRYNNVCDRWEIFDHSRTDSTYFPQLTKEESELFDYLAKKIITTLEY